MESSRRKFLIGACSLLATPYVAQAGSGPRGDIPWLKHLGAEKGIAVGSCFSGIGDAVDRALLRQHAAVITPEWCLKPKYLKRTETGPYRFAEADAIYEFARSANASMHGHTLFWHADRFDWADSKNLEDVKRKYGTFLNAVITRYPDLPSWDVANEVVADEGVGLLRDEYLFQEHGLNFLDFLFRRTRDLAPAARLCLNDYNLECGQPWCTDKRRRLLSLIDELRARKVPIDAVGIQSHLSSRYGLNIEETLSFLDQMSARGLTVYLSETDVNDAVFPDDITERDEAVAEMYRAYLTPVLKHPAVKRLMFWGLSDRDHWLVREQVKESRAAGMGRPALFDADAKPKPAFFAVVQALKDAPVRGP